MSTERSALSEPHASGRAYQKAAGFGLGFRRRLPRGSEAGWGMREGTARARHRVPVWRNPADGRRSGLGGALSPDGGVSPHFSFSPGPWTVSTVQNYKGFHSDLVLSRSWNHFS